MTQHEHLPAHSLQAFQRKVAVLSGAGMFIDGFDVSVIAVALPGLKESWGITGIVEGLVASAAIVGMFFGMLFGGRLADRFGRRRMYLIDLTGFICFALLAAMTQNPVELILTRLLLGLFIGADYPISSSITAEFTPPATRGRYIIFMSLMWQAGAFFAYLAGMAMFGIGDNAWRWMLMLGAVIAVIVLFMRAEVPESPRWLRAHGRNEEAEEVMVYIRHIAGNDAALHAAGLDAGASAAPVQKTRWVELFSRRMIKATVFCSVFWFAFAVSFYGIQMYTPTILAPFTSGSKVLSYAGSAVIALLGVAGAAIGMISVEKIGRRKQMLWAFLGMVIVLSALALGAGEQFGMLVALLAGAILLANLGPGVLDMVYPNEMFPTRLRGSGVGFAGSISRIGAILGVTVFPEMVQTWGMAHSTWLFAGVAAFGMIVSFFLAPETKGKSLDELEALANAGWPRGGLEAVVSHN